VDAAATPVGAPPQAQAPAQSQDQGPPAGASALPEAPGFRSRGSARRRARFLRKARELAYRDLGGLVFNLHRFGQRNDALVLAKLTTLGHIDAELRALEGALQERRPLTVLREAGITACPRCAAIHSSEDHFCPNCGLSMGRRVDLPVAGAPAPNDAGVLASQLPPSRAPQTQAPLTAAPQTQAHPVAPPSAAPGAPPSAAPSVTAVTDAVPPSRPPGAGSAPDEPTEILRPGGADR